MQCMDRPVCTYFNDIILCVGKYTDMHVHTQTHDTQRHTAINNRKKALSKKTLKF